MNHAVYADWYCLKQLWDHYSQGGGLPAKRDGGWGGGATEVSPLQRGHGNSFSNVDRGGGGAHQFLGQFISFFF